MVHRSRRHCITVSFNETSQRSDHDPNTTVNPEAPSSEVGTTPAPPQVVVNTDPAHENWERPAKRQKSNPARKAPSKRSTPPRPTVSRLTSRPTMRKRDLDKNTRIFLYGGLLNSPERLFPAYPPIFPFSIDIALGAWESNRIEADLKRFSEKIRGEPLSEPISTKHKITRNTSGSRFHLPYANPRIVKRIHAMTPIQRLTQAVNDFNVGNRAQNIANAYMPSGVGLSSVRPGQMLGPDHPTSALAIRSILNNDPLPSEPSPRPPSSAPSSPSDTRARPSHAPNGHEPSPQQNGHGLSPQPNVQGPSNPISQKKTHHPGGIYTPAAGTPS